MWRPTKGSLGSARPPWRVRDKPWLRPLPISRAIWWAGIHAASANAIRLAHRLEPYDIGFYEEPVSPENIPAMEKVARAMNVPIATGERLFTVFGFRELFERQVADIIQPDPCHTGGISGLKRIAGIAEAYYIAVAPHNPNGPVATAVCLQLVTCLPNFLFLEAPLDLGIPWRKELLTDPLETFVDGQYKLPIKPGLASN